MTIKSKTSRAAITTSILIALLVVISTVPAGVLAQSGGETEPNDARATATPLQDSISGEIGVKGDADWYSAEFTRGETVSFLITNKQVDITEISVSLYKPSEKFIIDIVMNINDTRAQIATTANKTGTYYIDINPAYSGSGINTSLAYTIRVAGQSAPPQTTSPPTTDTVTSQTATLSTTTQTATGTTTSSMATTETQTSGTDTSAQTGTSTSSGTSSSANTPVEKETTSMFGPGFTSVGAIIALLSGVLFSVRRC